MARAWWPPTTTASRWRPSMAARRACWSRTSTSGNRPSGSVGCVSWSTTSRASGSRSATTLVLDVPGWPGHLAGQHVDVRLTAEDGYQAQRSYSIASPPKAPQLALTVERLDGGEVSPWLAGEARPGDRFELRGPIGGYFTWSVAMSRPLMLVGGGSGVVPLMAMLRHRAASGEAGRAVPASLLLSSRSF